ncbi:MAG: helix-turn-helix domain-containing protein [Lachnospiraceae bacterium]
MTLLKDPKKSQNIAKRIRNERKKLKMTQLQFSRLLGISCSYLGALERGSRNLSINMARRFHEVLCISYDYLLDGITLPEIPLQQFVKESSTYDIRQKVDVILGTCTPEELESCYELIHSFIINKRKRRNARKT